MRWNFTENQSVATGTSCYPDLSETNEFRLTTSAEWLIKLDHAEGLSFKLGLDNEYESRAAGGGERNDLKYYGALVLDF